jgi:hypothetical protein
MAASQLATSKPVAAEGYTELLRYIAIHKAQGEKDTNARAKTVFLTSQAVLLANSLHRYKIRYI